VYLAKKKEAIKMNLINLDPTENLNECLNSKVHGCELEVSLDYQIKPGCVCKRNVSVLITT
jgi:hypothetical protein